jgi:16S rRNA G966 N2-methylase RsmD
MLDDTTFGKMARGPESGGINAGRDLPAEIAARATDTNDMRENLWLLYSIVRGMNAKRILEIGTFDGTSTMAFVKAASEIGGHVTSMDWSDVPVAEALVKQYGLEKHWTFMRGDSHELLPKLHAEGRVFDAILVDADHSAKGARQDIIDSERMLAPGGVLFTHDNWMVASDHDWSKPAGQRGLPGCGLVGKEMLASKDWTGVILTFGSNLGIWRRRSECDNEIAQAIRGAQEAGLLPSDL